MRYVRLFKCRPPLILPVIFLLVLANRLHADEIDEFVKAVMQQRHIPAISIAVVEDGALIKAGAYGFTNVEHNIAARTDSVYKIGSVSKQFIAAGMMLLVQDGKVAVDDKVSKHLQGTPNAWHDITLRHLLTHTSGLEFLKNPPESRCGRPSC